MKTDDFIKLPAREAGDLYRQHQTAGDTAEASRLHQAYYEAHRIRLSDDQQVEEAMAQPAKPAALPVPTPRGARSTVRRVGVVVSLVGLVIGAFAAAAGIGAVGLTISAAMASSGFALWLVGVLEDRLIEIRNAIAL